MDEESFPNSTEQLPSLRRSGTWVTQVRVPDVPSGVGIYLYARGGSHE